MWDALDERGERELALKAAIKARFDIEEPPVVYELTGSAFIGKKVKRTFGRRVRILLVAYFAHNALISLLILFVPYCF